MVSLTRKLLTLFIIFFICGSPSFAQNFLKKYELEIGGSAILAGKKYNGDFDKTLNFYSEIRRNFTRLPMDIGFHFGKGTMYREWENPFTTNDYHYLSYLVISNYYFSDSKKVSPFIGIGMGITHLKIDWSYIENSQSIPHGTQKDDSFNFMMRGGVEIYRFLRISTSYKFMKRKYSNYEISIGLTLGGWR